MSRARSSNAVIDVCRLRDLLDYHPDTGELRWRQSRGGIKKGSVAGLINVYGYRRIRLCGLYYTAHRLAWLHVHSEWPADEIDHINGDRSDNRLANLRVATKSQNAWNRKRSKSAGGLKGIHRGYGGKWVAKITYRGSKVNLGSFPTPEAAHAAYVSAAHKHFGEFARAA